MALLVGRLLVPSFLLLGSRLVTAARTNRTIDDEKGDSVSGLVPEYSPAGAWNQGSTCTECLVQLDPSQTLDGTWHDTTTSSGDKKPRTITVRFNGTAVYVYNALANTVAFADTGTNLTFMLDGSLIGHFEHTPTNSTLFDYNIPVYTNESLPNKEHELVIQTGGNVTPSPSLVLFDYVVYTFDDTPTSTTPTSSTTSTRKPSSTSAASSFAHSSPPTATIAGGVVGGIGALLVLVGLSVFICRRRRRHHGSHIQVIQEKPRKGKIVTRLSILGSEFDPPSATYEAAGPYPRRSTLATDVESQDHIISISQRSPIPLPDVPASASSSRLFHEGRGFAWSPTGSTAPPTPRGAYLFGEKSAHMDIAAEDSRNSRPPVPLRNSRPPIPLPPASPADPRSRSRHFSNRETAALRSQVAALKKEVEQLQERRKTVVNASSDDGASDAPPPEYDGLGGSSHP